MMPESNPLAFPNGVAVGVLLTSLTVRHFGGGEAGFEFLVTMSVLWAVVSLLLSWRNR